MNNNDIPLVSIIALCYNHAAYCTETLNSILGQTYSRYELIIMDDCSTDESVRLIHEWISQNPGVEVKFFVHDENKGICKTLNEAIRHAKGDYIAMIACDDIMMPEKTEVQVACLERTDDDVAAVFSDAYLIKADSTPRYGRFIQKHRDFDDVPSGNIYDELLVANFIPAMAATIKKSVYSDVGEYDESLGYEDYDMWLRIAQKYKFLYHDYISAKYRLHGANLHKTYDRFAKDKVIIYAKHGSADLAIAKVSDNLLKLYLTKGRKVCLNILRSVLKGFPVSEILKVAILLGIPAKIVKYAYILKRKTGNMTYSRR